MSRARKVWPCGCALEVALHKCPKHGGLEGALTPAAVARLFRVPLASVTPPPKRRRPGEGHPAMQGTLGAEERPWGVWLCRPDEAPLLCATFREHSWAVSFARDLARRFRGRGLVKMVRRGSGWKRRLRRARPWGAS